MTAYSWRSFRELTRPARPPISFPHAQHRRTDPRPRPPLRAHPQRGRPAGEARAQRRDRASRCGSSSGWTRPRRTSRSATPCRCAIVRQFQEWGHKAVLIIGDYTARVGDPTGRNKTRKVLTGEEIDANAKTYVAQVGKILLTDPEHLEIRYNGEWLGKMGLVDVIKLAGPQDGGAGADARGLRQALRRAASTSACTRSSTRCCRGGTAS